MEITELEKKQMKASLKEQNRHIMGEGWTGFASEEDSEQFICENEGYKSFVNVSQESPQTAAYGVDHPYMSKSPNNVKAFRKGWKKARTELINLRKKEA